MIPFKRINLGKSLQAIRPLIKSGYIGLGKVVTEFEEELAKYVGSKYVVATDSCTSAIFLSLKYERKTNKRKYLIIPSMTVPLVPNAIIEAGYSIKFNDQTDWVGSAYQIQGSNVWDSAHQLQRDQYKKMKNSKIKLCFSFYPTKTIGSADGGAIATNDKDFYNWAKSVSTYGRDMSQSGNSWDYDVARLGYKRHYTNLQAAICLEQLRRLDQTNTERQRIVEIYNDAFDLNNKSDYLYRIDIENRDEFIEYAKKNGVECGVHFKPVHMMKPFKKFEVKNKEKIEEAYRKTVSLPFYDTMTDKEINKVINTVFNFKCQ